MRAHDERVVRHLSGAGFRSMRQPQMERQEAKPGNDRGSQDTAGIHPGARQMQNLRFETQPAIRSRRPDRRRWCPRHQQLAGALPILSPDEISSGRRTCSRESDGKQEKVMSKLECDGCGRNPGISLELQHNGEVLCIDCRPADSESIQSRSRIHLANEIDKYARELSESNPNFRGASAVLSAFARGLRNPDES